MFVAYEISNTEPVTAIKGNWGSEWERYLSAIMKGFVSAIDSIKNQIELVCFRERIDPAEICFVFHIGPNATCVEVFIRIKDISRFLSLALDPRKHFHLLFRLETKEELENDSEWERVAEYRAWLAMKYLASDLARTGIPSEINMSIILISQFSKILYESRILLETDGYEV